MAIPEKKMNTKEIIDNTKAEILNEIRDKLLEIEEGGSGEIYFHDVVTTAVDMNAPEDRMDALKLIDDTGLEKHVDKGVIDTFSIDRILVTTAYECLHQSIFEDDFIQDTLQGKLNNEEISYQGASKLIEIVNAELKKYRRVIHTDNANQLWVKVTSIMRGKESAFLMSDFEKHFPKENIENGQITELSDHSFKIFTSNKEINKNAIVMEGTDKPEFRVYLMCGKDKDLDIRELFKVIPASIKEADYNLSVDLYVNGKVKKEYKDKDELVRQVFKVANKLLTERGKKMKCAVVKSKDVFDTKKNPNLCLSAKRFTNSCVNCSVFNRLFYETIKVKKTEEELASGIEWKIDYRFARIRVPVDDAIKKSRCSPIVSKTQMDMLRKRDILFKEKDKVQEEIDKINESLRMPVENMTIEKIEDFCPDDIVFINPSGFVN